MTRSPQTAAENDPLLGQTLQGRYLIQSLIDRGGMGKVYRAVQQPLGRPVALKTLDLLDPRGEFRERFFNEASTASKLTHPNTVRIFDYGRSDDGVYFLTMELLEGQSLHKLVKAEAPLDPLRVIHILRQVCGALHEAHEQGIVHRDLKPGNIYLTQHGDELEFAKVLDFGLVKDLDSDVNLSQTGQALGSPLYMAPEQVEGDPVDRRSDVYALGLVMYVALCGRVPFKRGSVATIMMQQVTGKIPTFDEIAPGHNIPPSLEWVVRRCIEKKPDDRIASMRELSAALKLCDREIRGEVQAPIPWKLSPVGMLALPEDLMGRAEETAVRAERIVVNDIPSSPTLNRSAVSSTTIAVAGAGVGVVGLIVLALAVVVIIGIIAFVVTREVEPSVDPVPTEQPVPVTEPVPEPPPAPEPVVPVVEVVEVRVTSTPAGAEVTKDGSLMGVTPVTLKIHGEPLNLTVQADGYEPRTILADGTVDEVAVPLKKKKRTITRPKPAPTPVPEAPPVKPAGSPNMTEIRDPWEDG